MRSVARTRRGENCGVAVRSALPASARWRRKADRGLLGQCRVRSGCGRLSCRRWFTTHCSFFAHVVATAGWPSKWHRLPARDRRGILPRRVSVGQSSFIPRIFQSALQRDCSGLPPPSGGGRRWSLWQIPTPIAPAFQLSPRGRMPRQLTGWKPVPLGVSVCTAPETRLATSTGWSARWRGRGWRAPGSPMTAHSPGWSVR